MPAFQQPASPAPPGCPWIKQDVPLTSVLVTVSMGSVPVPRRIMQEILLFFVRRSPWITRAYSAYELGDSLEHKHVHVIVKGFIHVPKADKKAREALRTQMRKEMNLQPAKNGGSCHSRG
jgi:hypothetical protein